MTAKATIAGAISESDLQAAVIELARLRGWRCAHVRPSLNQRGQWASHVSGDPGLPDLILARKGIVLFVELKSEKGKLTKDQELWRDALGLGRAFVWKPSQWTDGKIARFLE